MLLDSNIIIYSFQSQYQALQAFMKNRNTGCSAITCIETLVYHQLSENEKLYLQRCFDTITIFPVTHAVIKTSISLRQKKSLSLGDAIIAATALEYHQTLVTRNIRDFDWIEGLKVVNPLDELA